MECNGMMSNAAINGLPHLPQCEHRWGIWVGIDSTIVKRIRQSNQEK